MTNQIILKKSNAILENCNLNISGSKSISQRALIIQFLNSHNLELNNLSESNDTKTLSEILKEIKKINKINVGQGGTTLRFLVPLLSLIDKEFKIDGHSTLKSRPFLGLVNALKQFGVKFKFFSQNSNFPFKIHGGKMVSKLVTIESDKTSQFVSGLLLIGPYTKGGLKLKLNTKTVSLSYIEMTIQMMRICGANVSYEKNLISVKEGGYSSIIKNIESDWTSLSYIYECIAISDKAEITVSSFRYPSLQKDSDIILFFNFLGVLTKFNNDSIIIKKISNSLPILIEWDVLNNPDLMPTYLVSCFALGVNLKLKGIESLAYKESNRLQSVKSNLEKFNAKIRINNNVLILDSSNSIFVEKEIDTYSDHRIALAFSPLVIKTKSLKINNPHVVEKSYPKYWNHLNKMGIEVFFQK